MNHTMEELLEIAEPFRDPDDETLYRARSRVNIGPGELAATDGRILIHISDPAIVPAEGEQEPNPGIIGAKWAAGTVIARRARLGMIAAMIVPVWEEAAKAVKERQEAFGDPLTEARKRGLDIRECPCCGRDFIDDGGEFYTPEDWAAEYRPHEAEVEDVVELTAPGQDKPIRLLLRHLGKALAAAQQLGGADSLEVCEFPVVVLRGPGWFVAIARIYPDTNAKADTIEIRLDGEDAGKEAGND